MPDEFSKAPLVKKFAIKPKMRITAVNPPEGFRESLAELPSDTVYAGKFDGTFDWIMLFASTQSELEERLSPVLAHLTASGILWIAIPRGKKATELNRNSMIDLRSKYNVETVSNAVVNDDWTAYRFKKL